MSLLKMLTRAEGPSGNEASVREVIKQQITSVADEIYTDNLGNLIARIRGNGPKVMIDAHMDEVGIIVTFIEENGLLRFSNLGRLLPRAALSQRVKFLNGASGVVYNEQKEDTREVKLSDLYIDIGAKNRAEAESRIRVGDVACFEGAYDELGSCVVSKALDDRAGCFVLIEAMKKLWNQGSRKNDLYFVFSVTEELGFRGAKAAVNNILPDFAVVIDVVETDNFTKKNKTAVKLGEGPAIKVKDSTVICHPYVKELMVKACRENGIKYQMEVVEAVGSDAGAIQISNGGVPTGAISIPARYVHTPCEMMNTDDLKDTVKLLSKLIETGFYM